MSKKHDGERSLVYRCEASKRNKEWQFFAALSHALKDCHIDPFGHDQWHLPLVLTTVLGYLFLRRWELVFLLFAIYYLLEYMFYFLMRSLTRRTTAEITARHKRSTELLIDPLIFSFAFFVAWYILDYTVIGHGVNGPAQPWRSAVVIGVSVLSGHARAYWLTLGLLLATIWITHLVVIWTSNSHTELSYALWLSLRASGFTLYFFATFIVPINNHFLQNALFSLLLALFFSSAIHAISLG